MPHTYDKPTTPSGIDRTLILDPRQAMVYPFPYEDWTILNMGMLISATSAIEDNAYLNWSANFKYSVNTQTPRDRIYIGLKGNNPDFPGENGENFMGILATSGANDIRRVSNGFSNASMAFENNTSPEVIDVGVVHNNGGFSSSSINYMKIPCAECMSGSGNYSSFHALHFTINNKGESGQSVTIKYCTTMEDNAGGIPKKTDNELKNMMAAGPYTTIGTFPWNNSGGPYDIPDAIFMYIPWSQVRLRIHNVGVIQYQ